MLGFHGNAINLLVKLISYQWMFVYNDVTSNNSIISSSSMETILMELGNVAEFFVLLFSSLTWK